MAVSLTEVGIQQIDLTLITQSSVEVVLEEAEPLLNGDGTLDDNPLTTFNPEMTFEFSGIGSVPVGIACGGDLPEGGEHEEIDGGITLIDRIDYTEYAEKRNEWRFSGLNCPNATVPT